MDRSPKGNGAKGQPGRITATILFLAAIVASCSPGGDGATATPTATWLAGDLGWGSVTGVVADSLTGRPVAGATVSCTQHSYVPRTICSGSTVTDRDGRFSFEGVFFHDTDIIALTVSASGYVEQQFMEDFFTRPDLYVNISLVRVGPTPAPCCTAPACQENEVHSCPGTCPCGCGTTCATVTPAAVCTQPACRPYDALCCPSGNCTGGCGLTCVTPQAVCTPPHCAIGTNEAYTCPSGCCPGGCGTTCATYTPTP